MQKQATDLINWYNEQKTIFSVFFGGAEGAAKPKAVFRNPYIPYRTFHFSRKSFGLIPPEKVSHVGRSFEHFVSGGSLFSVF